MATRTSPTAHLRAAGVSLVVDLTGLPRVLHWGADLGETSGADLAALVTATRPWVGDSPVTYPHPVPVLPQLADGWLGEPGITGHRDGRAWAPVLTVDEVSVHDGKGGALATGSAVSGGGTVAVRATDDASGLSVTMALTLSNRGLLTVAIGVTNTGESGYELHRLSPVLTVPQHADELIDFTGRWSLERVPQRRPFAVGDIVRESRGGKPGLEHTGLLIAGERGAGFRSGEVWGIHLAWPGNQRYVASRTPYDTRTLAAGELLHPGELVLAPGETYSAPALLGSYGTGLDELAGRFHAQLRDRPHHSRRPRPVTVNTWEAVYFDHVEERVLRLAERAAQIGAERFVLDDGWFAGRRDATTSLGDWTPDAERWPAGLRPLADRVHALGMDFGLWVEPEMVSVDSELARSHPQWFFDAGHGIGLSSRDQYVLDLGHPDAAAHVTEAISALVTDVGIDFLKWDHNRYLLDAGHRPHGRAGTRAQTVAALTMMRTLIARHRGLEIETCASGGGRADLASLDVATRMWPSDCNDPLERVEIFRSSSLLLPPEMVGTHIGAARDHITGRTNDLAFRASAALWGNLGIELDLLALDESTLAELSGWVDLHKRFRPLLHSGRVVHGDTETAVRLDGVVATDGSEALYGYTLLRRPPTWPPARLRFPGLDSGRTYAVTVPSAPGADLPPWARETATLPGSVLTRAGIEAISLLPASSALIHLEAQAR